MCPASGQKTYAVLGHRVLVGGLVAQVHAPADVRRSTWPEEWINRSLKIMPVPVVTGSALALSLSGLTFLSSSSR